MTDQFTQALSGLSNGDAPGEAAPEVSQVPPAVEASEAYAELAGIVLGAQPLGAVMTRIAQLSRKVVPGADDVSVTLLIRDKPHTVAFCGERAAVLDERQYQAGAGPCLDAAASGSVITVDTAQDELYAQFSRQAHRAGIRHVLAIGWPTIATDTAGAVNFYTTGAAFAEDSRQVAAGFAAYVAVAVTNASIYAGAVLEVEQMRTALTSRAIIEQAKGILMGQEHCNSDAAFTLLRAASNNANLKLRDLAQRLVEAAENHETPVIASTVR